MAHKMVRQPSETPNINNIDDIVPFRYAYGNQDGYVIGKGQELEATNLGNSIRINSGRVVLQGVEDDIDANGVTFTIDNIASLRYYAIYYRVNLATNTTSYEIISDGVGYPTIDAGDDLTKNSSGIANLPLYRFVASSGVISGVEKVVKPIEYINKNTTIKNTENVNNLPIERDENGVLKIGDIIIPQKKLIWSGNFLNNDSSLYKELDFEWEINDTLEIEYRLFGGGWLTAPTRQYFRVKILATTMNYIYTIGVLGDDIFNIAIDVGFGSFKVRGPKLIVDNSKSGSDSGIEIYNIYKIIE